MSKAAQTQNTHFEEEVLQELTRVVRIICLLAVFLYPLFAVCDFVMYRDFFPMFLGIRLAVVAVGSIGIFGLSKIKTLSQGYRYAALLSGLFALSITSMVFALNDAANPYYAGINLVAIGTITFIPWNRQFLAVIVSVIYGPYLAIAIQQYLVSLESAVLLPSFFSLSTAVITSAIRLHFNKVKLQEFDSRFKLNQEVNKRAKVIAKKVKSLARVKGLSRQFSPQVISAIERSELTLNEDVHRSNICSVFIDIVESTKHIATIDHQDVNKVISQFMKDTIPSLLKYDLTIDKFLGDGILAFSNDPVKHSDFLERAIFAAQEVIENIAKHSSYYSDYWLSPLRVRVGIASGFANVGFYGSEDAFRMYTAIGPCVNLASRLCAHAEPGSILVSSSIQRELRNKPSLEFHCVGDVVLKGFEQTPMRAFQVTKKAEQLENLVSELKCEVCQSGLDVSENAQGFVQLVCNGCGAAAAA